MVLLRDIQGQNNAVRYLSRSLDLERIAAAYLFSGPRGVGRVLAAKAFVSALFCGQSAEKAEACGQCPACRGVGSTEHPDIIWIGPDKNRAIKIAEIREVREKLNLKPYESPANVCIIEDAHMMTPEASNALLKVMEEPPGNSLLILITDKKELLLATVLSRCSEVRFGSLPVDETKNILLRIMPDLNEETAYFFAYLSEGSPGRALEMIEDGLAERKKDLISMVDSLVAENNAALLSWDSESKDRLIEDLEMMVMFFRDIAIGKEGLEEMVPDKDITGTEMYRFFIRYTTKEIYGIIERIINTKLSLEGNANAKLVAQALPGIIKP